MSDKRKASNELLMICRYENCNSVYERPITLTCCGKSICESHLPSLYSSYVQSKIKCCFCNEEISVPKSGFAISEVIERLINMNLGQKHKQAKEAAYVFSEKLKFYDIFKNNPHHFVKNYFENIRDDINRKRALVKQILDDYYDELIQKANSYENDCKTRINWDEMSTDYELEYFRIKNESWQTEVRKFIVDETRWESLSDDIKVSIKEIEFKLDSIKSQLLENKTYKFVSNSEDIGINCLGNISVFNNEFDEKDRRFDLISCSMDCSIKAWNLEKGICVQTFCGHGDSVFCVKFLTKDKIISCSKDGTIKLWNTANSESLKTFYLINSIPNYIIKLSDTEFISGADTGDINIWNINQDTYTKALRGHTSTIYCMEIYDNYRLISCSWDKSIKIWNMEKYNLIYSLSDHRGPVTFVKIVPNYKFATCSFDKSIKLWDVDSLACMGKLNGHKEGINAIEVLENNRLASGSNDGTIRIWDLYGSNCIKVIKCQSKILSIKSISENKIASSHEDTSIRIWNLNNYECVGILQGHMDIVYCIESQP